MMKKPRLTLVWTSHLRDQEAASKFREIVLSELTGNLVIDRLRELVLQRLEVIDTEIKSDDQFDKPSWGYWRANADGKRTALIDILLLLEKPHYDG